MSKTKDQEEKLIPRCIFCDIEVGEDKGQHHILPQVIRRQMGWTGKRAREYISGYKVPICTKCHKKLSYLQEPLIYLIKWLRQSPPIPVEFTFVLDGATKKLLEEE